MTVCNDLSKHTRARSELTANVTETPKFGIKGPSGARMGNVMTFIVQS